MDDASLRNLIDASLEAQKFAIAAEDNLRAAEAARDAARDRAIREIANLDAALSGASVIYGDRVIRVTTTGSYIPRKVESAPLLKVRVIEPAPQPAGINKDVKLAEHPKPVVTMPVNPFTSPPTSGGTIPSLGKKK